MIDFMMQLRPGQVFVPWSREDAELIRNNWRINQLVRLSGSTPRVDMRSYLQLKLFFKCCRKVAANTDHPDWNTFPRVYNSVRLALDFTRKDEAVVAPWGDVWFPLRSVSYDQLKHLEACYFFDRAIDTMASVIGVTKDELTTAGNLDQEDY